MEEWEEIKPWDEAPVATGPMKSSYSPGEKQAGNLVQKIGPELDRQLDIAVAKLQVLREFRQRYNMQRLDTAFIGVNKIMGLLETLEREVKNSINAGGLKQYEEGNNG